MLINLGKFKVAVEICVFDLILRDRKVKRKTKETFGQNDGPKDV